MTVGYEMEVYTASKSQRVVELSISVTYPSTGGALRPFTLVVNTADGTASIIAFKFYSNSLTLSFIYQEQMKTILL